jgi:hypothetical protein
MTMKRSFSTVLLLSSAALPAAGAKVYTTEFTKTENPLSEGERWRNGKAQGVDWQDVRTANGFATFTETNEARFDDSTAVLRGDWGSDQYVRAIVRIPTPDPAFAQEVEIRLRSTITAHSCTGYEVLGGSQIVRWNGPLGDFTVLRDEGPGGELHDGDVFEARVVGNVITVYINGKQVNRAVDNTFTNGSPGIGFFTRNPSASPFGLENFTASDAPLEPIFGPLPPTGLIVR